jgi:WhiB family redox-sensing transcriptional regulator
MNTEILLTAVDPVLRSTGRCADGAGSLVDIFFSEELHEIARAKAICAPCTVRDRCLSGAIARREPWGVWGGELFMNGHVLAQKRRRGRPPKGGHREIVVDELGAPIVASA